MRPLFPHDGGPGVAVEEYFPPDFTVTTRLRMAYANGTMRFMLQDTSGSQITWDYNPVRKGWKPSQFAVPMNLAYFEEGESLDSELLCGQDGNLYQIGGLSDNGVPISCNITAGYQANSRTEKFFGDAWLDADPQGVTLTVQQTFDLGVVLNTALAIGGVSRTQYPMNTSNSNGQLARNGGELRKGHGVAAAAPVIYEWDPWLYDTGTVLRTSWASLPTAHGLTGWQHVRDGYLPLWVATAGTVTLIVTIDGQKFYAAQNLPVVPTGDLLQKIRVDFPPAKGLMCEWQVAERDAVPWIFEKDLEITAKSWDRPAPTRPLKPFVDGA